MVISLEDRKNRAMSGWPMIIGWAGMLIFALHACTHMVAAGDTWVALASGRHFINHGVSTVEPFSANSHKAGPTPEEVKSWPGWAQWVTGKVGLETVKYWHPTGWVNQNWLTHVIFYWLTTLSPFADAESLSFNTLVYWKFAVYILAVICVYYTGIVLGVNPALSAAFACFSMFVGRTLLDIRPAGFSNLLVAVFLLVLVLASYRNILYIWLIVPLAVFWCNVHGGYIYLFIMLVPFVVVYFVTNFFSKRFVSIGHRGLVHSIAAGLTAFFAVIIFNPFHLTNLTHTFVISVSKHAELWRTINEWHPAFEWSNPVGDARPFLVMYIIAWAAFLIWMISLPVTYNSVSRRLPRRKANIQDEYRWPKVDLALMVIAALTVYMAICSRRFIPIGAIAACPLIAMFIDQTVRAISATYNFRRQNRLAVPSMPRNVQIFFVVAGIAAISTFGTLWGMKFKRVYLDPWPTDPKLTSLFMRMTASDAKPFYACRFIRDNRLKGKIFNYWTEGGFIAWGQEPDPNTGETPLKLFMDGRAQAAYEPNVYLTWSNIMIGGPIARNAVAKRRSLTARDYVEVSKWVGQELKKHNVWIALMPSDQFGSSFVRGLDMNRDWTLVYCEDKQKLFVDINSPPGRGLFQGIFSDETIFPDRFYEDIMKGHILLMAGKDIAAKKKGLEFLIEALKLKPSQAPMREIIQAAGIPELEPAANNCCKNYVEDFIKNKNLYAGRDGYAVRLWSVLIAVDHLQGMAEKRKDTALAKFYAVKKQEYFKEQGPLVDEKRW